MNPIHPTVVWLTWRQMFANKRLYLALTFALAPLVVTLMFRAFSPDVAADSRAYFLTLEREIVIGTLLPVAALVFGTTAFGGEVDDGTLLYLLTKPVARWRIVFSKYVVSVAGAAAVMLVAVVLPWLVVDHAALPAAMLRSHLLGVALGAVVYGALFTMLGLVHKQALAVGLAYVVVFEAVASRQFPGLRSLSVREYCNAVVQLTADASLELGTSALTAADVSLGATLLTVVTLTVAVVRLGRYEVSEKL